MRFLKIAVFLFFPLTLFSQHESGKLLKLKNSPTEILSSGVNSTYPMKKNSLSFLDSITESKETKTVKGSKKSPALAFLLINPQHQNKNPTVNKPNKFRNR